MLVKYVEGLIGVGYAVETLTRNALYSTKEFFKWVPEKQVEVGMAQLFLG